MKRVAGYVRVSSLHGREGDTFHSVKDQTKAISAYCKGRGHKLIDVVEELNESGGTMKRPRLQRLIADIEAGKIEGIVVAKLDRFARSVVGGIQALETIHAAGGFVVAIEENIDTSSNGTGTGDLQLHMMLALGQWGRTTRAEGFQAAKVTSNQQNGVHIAPVPVGYVKPEPGARYSLDKKKAPKVREAFERFATGQYTVSDIARRLDKTLPGGPSGGGVWNRNTGIRILQNRVFLGEARGGGVVNIGAHPAIVSVETFDMVQALLRRGDKPATAKGAKSLLAGVVRCGCCHYALDRNRVAGKHWVYRCNGRSASGLCEAPTSAMVHALDALVTEAVLERLDSQAIERVPVERDVADLHERIAAAWAKRELFEDAEYAAALGKAGALRALGKVDDEIGRLENELADTLPTPKTFAGERIHDVRDVWPTLSVDEQRQVIAWMLQAVTVSRGATRTTSLTDRVRFHWHGDDLGFALPSRGRSRTEIKSRLAAA
jgi:DNA invertase Pin-like site-specific DNA recombinase